MASGALIMAHANEFNKGILKDNACYFSSASDIEKLIGSIKKNDNLHLIQNNLDAITDEFSWETINGKYLRLFEESLSGPERR
jgi:hypothetical protein